MLLLLLLLPRMYTTTGIGYCVTLQDLRYIEELRKLREAEAAIMSKAKGGRGAEYESVTTAGGRSGLWRPPTKPLAAASP